MIPARGRQRQEDKDLKANLGYIVSLSQLTKDLQANYFSLVPQKQFLGCLIPPVCVVEYMHASLYVCVQECGGQRQHRDRISQNYIRHSKIISAEGRKG